MMRNAVWVLIILTMATGAGALQTNLPSLADVAYYTPYDQKGGDISKELVTGNDGLLMTCHNSTSDQYTGVYPVGTTLGDKIDGFDVGKFGNSLNGSSGWMNINMVNSQSPSIQRFSMSFWLRFDPAITYNDSGLAYLWEVRDGWSLDESKIDLEHKTNSTNVDYLQLQVDYRDGENKIKVGYNGGGGWQEFSVPDALIEDGNWHNIIINYQGYYSNQPPYYQQGTDIDLYIDGVEIPCLTSDFVPNGWGAIRVEAFGFGNHFAKSGMGVWVDFDDFALWNRTLTADEIAWIASGVAPIALAGPTYLSGGYPAGDFDKNGTIDQADFGAMIDSWMGNCAVIDCGQTNEYVNDLFDLPNFAAFAQNWLLSPDTGPTLTIERDSWGVPTFKVDGAFTTAAVFSHAQPTDTNPVKGFADIGTIIQDVGAMDLENWWKGTNPYRSNYVTLHRYMDKLVDPTIGDPDVILFPWINLVAPQWWSTDPANVNELEVLSSASGMTSTYPDGRKYGSLASEKWRQDVKAALENYIDFLYLSGRMNNIGGFKIADTGCGGENLWRWAHDSNVFSGYGVRTQEAFRQWLRTKYNNDINALESAWNNTGINSFENVQVPPRSSRILYGSTELTKRTFRDPAVYMNVIDFELFYNDLLVETLDYFAGVIKNKTNHSKLVGGFYCYMYEWCGNPMDGHQALRKYNSSENLDFVWQTASYQNRLHTVGADVPRGPAYSSQLHGKQWMNSNDTATYLSTELNAADRINYAYTDTVAKNKQMFLRSAGFNICNNGLLQEFFSLHDGWYNDPALVAAAGQVNQIYLNSKNYDRTTNAQVLIVTDEVSCSYTTYTAGDSQLLASVLRAPQLAIAQMGAPADHILVDDIALLPNPSQYKLVIFMNCWHLSNAQRTLIDSLKGNNRMLVFCYAPGYFNGNSASTAYMQALTGMNITVASSESFAAPRVYVKNDHPLGAAIIAKGVSNFGPTSGICRRIYVNDSSTTRLGTESSTGNTYRYMAIKDMGTWKSLYIVTPQTYLESAKTTTAGTVLREIARYAGVHIYNEYNDAFYANSSYVSIHPNISSGSQNRTLTFPFAVNLYDAETETLVASNTTSYTRSYTGGETKVYRYVRAQ